MIFWNFPAEVLDPSWFFRNFRHIAKWMQENEVVADNGGFG